MFLAALIIFLVFLLYIFVSRKRSPVPYFPTNKKDIPLIIKALNLKLNHTVVDLGAGDGVVIFKAAEETYKRGFGTKFYAVEINPILILILYLKKLFHENRKNIHRRKTRFSFSLWGYKFYNRRFFSCRKTAHQGWSC